MRSPSEMAVCSPAPLQAQAHGANYSRALAPARGLVLFPVFLPPSVRSHTCAEKQRVPGIITYEKDEDWNPTFTTTDMTLNKRLSLNEAQLARLQNGTTLSMSDGHRDHMTKHSM